MYTDRLTLKLTLGSQKLILGSYDFLIRRDGKMKGINRNNTLRFLMFTGSLLLASTSNAQLCDFCFSPYIGADLQDRRLGWKNDASDVFSKDAPQANIYGGLQFCDFLGLEGGYEASLPKTRSGQIGTNSFLGSTSFTPPGGVVRGALVPPVFTESRFQISGWHGSILGTLPLFCPEIKLNTTVGLAYLTAIHSATVLSDFRVGERAAGDRFFYNSTKKVVLRLGVSLAYLFDQCTGLKFSVNWENTARFKNLSNQGAPVTIASPPASVSMKNSWMYGIGLFTKF